MLLQLEGYEEASVAESRTVSRETRLRFARLVSRDLSQKSRMQKVTYKIWPIVAKIKNFKFEKW